MISLPQHVLLDVPGFDEVYAIWRDANLSGDRRVLPLAHAVVEAALGQAYVDLTRMIEQGFKTHFNWQKFWESRFMLELKRNRRIFKEVIAWHPNPLNNHFGGWQINFTVDEDQAYLGIDESFSYFLRVEC